MHGWGRSHILVVLYTSLIALVRIWLACLLDTDQERCSYESRYIL